MNKFNENLISSHQYIYSNIYDINWCATVILYNLQFKIYMIHLSPCDLFSFCRSQLFCPSKVIWDCRKKLFSILHKIIYELSQWDWSSGHQIIEIKFTFIHSFTLSTVLQLTFMYNKQYFWSHILPFFIEWTSWFHEKV